MHIYGTVIYLTVSCILMEMIQLVLQKKDMVNKLMAKSSNQQIEMDYTCRISDNFQTRYVLE